MKLQRKIIIYLSSYVFLGIFKLTYFYPDIQNIPDFITNTCINGQIFKSMWEIRL